MSLRVAVWGTGNVGRPALRAVMAHKGCQLTAVIVSADDKVGKDAGELADMPQCGVTASKDAQAAIDAGLDCMIYAASADTRPDEAREDLLSCLRQGVNVVSTSFYDFLDPALAPAEALDPVQKACDEGGSSLFISGIDPGWAMDVLPVFVSGMVSDIEEIRAQEIFNYALYDAPDIVRYVIGFGQPMSELPLMLYDEVLMKIWAPMLHSMAKGLGRTLDKVETRIERRELDQTVEVQGMGRFDNGTQGAFRFEVVGYCEGEPRFVVEHITRIHEDCAKDWPYPPEEGGCHRILLTGNPNLTVTVHGDDENETGAAAGGNASAASRIVNAIPAVCDAKPGVVTPWDLPPITGAAQLR